MSIKDKLRHMKNMSNVILLRLGIYRTSKFWDIQYKIGRWEGMTSGRRSRFVELAEKYANGGNVVELACGEGTLIFSMSRDSYKTYTGFDISFEAIDRANLHAKEYSYNNCSFQQKDIFDWSGGENLSLVIFEECIYYFTLAEQVNLLNTAMQSLLEFGSVLIAYHSEDKHRGSMDNLLSLGYPCKVYKDQDCVYLAISRHEQIV